MRIPGSSRAVSRDPGAAPRTSAATTLGSGSTTTVHPVRAIGIGPVADFDAGHRSDGVVHDKYRRGTRGPMPQTTS